MPYIEVSPGVNVYVEDWGSGKTIFFIHGWPVSHKMFEYQFTQLPKHGYRCVGIDLRGFGKSDKPWGDYNYNVFADDVKRVLEVMDLRDVTMAGFSMGGAIAMRYMARHSGERVSKVALPAAAAPPSENGWANTAPCSTMRAKWRSRLALCSARAWALMSRSSAI